MKVFNTIHNNNYVEHKMINRFEKLFGIPEETIVCFGDYEQK